MSLAHAIARLVTPAGATLPKVLCSAVLRSMIGHPIDPGRTGQSLISGASQPSFSPVCWSEAGALRCALIMSCPHSCSCAIAPCCTQVEEQRDMSRAAFTDPEGLEFDHDEVRGCLL